RWNGSTAAWSRRKRRKRAVGAPESMGRTTGGGAGTGRATGIERVLITGGAGFVGSHLADQLLARGYQVRVLDNLSEQVHGESISRPAYLDAQVELERGDVRDEVAVRRALRGGDAVCHLAAAVGGGQRLDESEHCTA